MTLTSKEIVSIVITTCGRKDYLRACLDSLRKQSYPHLEIIVIDNSSSADFAQKIIQSYPEIKLYAYPEKLSYCRSLNQGIVLSKGKFVLCLNDDLTLDKDYLKEALEGFSFNPRIGMVSGKILRADAKTIDSTGLFLSYFLTAKERGYGKKDVFQFEKPGYIFGVNGAVAFYRREMLEEIKKANEYFPDAFGFFYEDLDLAWRAQRRGWRGYYIPRAICYHLRGGTLRAEEGIGRPFARRYLSNDLLRDLIKNRHLTIIRNESLLGFLIHLPGLVIFEIASWGMSWQKYLTKTKCCDKKLI